MGITIPKTFCRKCGTEMLLIRIRHEDLGHNGITGKPIWREQVLMTCPHHRWWNSHTKGWLWGRGDRGQEFPDPDHWTDISWATQPLCHL
jgi:hypothetical protein